MRVFVTGSTGFIGTAVVQELLNAGHEVIGLARTEAGAETLTKMGALVHHGSLEDLESLRRGAASADGVIHLAFAHDLSHISFTKRIGLILGGLSGGIINSFGKTMVGLDTKAIAAIGNELEGTNRPFVTVLGTLSLKPGVLGTEKDDGTTDSFGGLRSQSERAMLALAKKGVRTSVVRLPPTVHGSGDKAFVPMMIKAAQKAGGSAYVGDGNNRWPAVHRLDAARLLRLALEKGEAGSKFHGVAEEGVSIRQIAETIGRKLNVPVVSKSGKAASKHFGWLSMILSVDNPVSSQWTQSHLGWQPTQPGLIDDLENSGYFTK